jgi:drug/metabolite transporter (DMT)-like permease
MPEVPLLPSTCRELCKCHVHPSIAAAVVLITWLSLNIGLNFFNKEVFSERVGFTFPIFFTMFHMVASFFGGAILIFVFKAGTVTKAHWTDYKYRIMLLSLLFVTNISCNNASLVHLSLSVNQIVKSCVPLPTMILSVAFERDANGQPKSYSKGVIVSLLITVLGSVLAVYGNPEASPFGLALVIISTLAVALWSVMSAMLLGPDSGLNAISLTWYASIISFVLLFILWACSNEREAATAYLHSRPGDATLIILLGSSTAFVYNLVHFALIKVTSALTSAVAGNIKILLVIILSMIFFEKSVTILNYAGFVVFLVGVFAYSTFIYRSKMRAASKPADSGDALVSRPKIEGSTERTVLISGNSK